MTYGDLRCGTGSGNHQFPGDFVQPGRGDRGQVSASLPPDLSPTRLGGARSHGDLGHHCPGTGGGGGQRPYRPQADCCRGHYQPAGDHYFVGPPHRRTGQQRHRVAVPPDGAHLRPTQGGRPGGDRDRENGPSDRCLFFRHQAAVAAGPYSRRPAAGRAGGAAGRHGGQLAHLEPDRRQGPCDGLLQCLPHHALQYPHPPVGRGSVCGAAGSDVAAAVSPVQQRDLRRHRTGAAGAGDTGGDPHLRQRGRPAGGAVRPGVLYHWSGQKYLRHRLLYPDECGPHAGAVPSGPCDLRRLVGEGADRLCLGGQRIQCGQRHPVAEG